jgi:hypothetical protein
MRRFVECLTEQPDEMIAREAGLTRNLIEIERTVLTIVYERARRKLSACSRADECALQ